LQCLGVQTLNFALDVVAEAPSAQATGRHAACAQQVRPTRRSAPAVVLPAGLAHGHVRAEQPAAGAPDPRRRGRLWRTLPAALADRRGVDRKHARPRHPVGEQPQVLGALAALSR
jgi:hypothetical protein